MKQAIVGFSKKPSILQALLAQIGKAVHRHHSDKRGAGEHIGRG